MTCHCDYTASSQSHLLTSLGKFRQVWTWLCTPGHNQPTIVLLDVAFGNYLFTKNLRHWLILSRDIGNKRILQSDWNKTHFSQSFKRFGNTWQKETFFHYTSINLSFQVTFNVAIPHQTNQIHPWLFYACLGVTGPAWLHLPSSNSLACYLFQDHMQKI